ncbi:MAG: 30S ribosomal protein S12 methylthiotransferase RimO [Flavobacteriales bacterium]|nr:30S ribosomal protein S12 methylthiotransferase RimO [Flavobacteriales bacterium]MCB9448059.1 30S ribosomal protein S12 methylthiotransferase RimO [Flavobacteriales bacterium]
MRTKAGEKKVHVITLGCSKNIYDSEILMGQLRANQMEVAHEEAFKQAGTVVINTCGFIEDAKQESIDTILRMAEAKKAGKVRRVLVTGCLSERYKDDLRKEIPEIDEWFGTQDLPQLLKSLGANYKQELIGERRLTTPAHFAYLKISEGCDRVCSFCAIPQMRGGHVSRPMESLVKEAASLAEKGVKELVLIAQDLTYYGLDLYKKRELAALLEKLADVKGIRWIRLHYAFPQGFPMEVLDVMARHDNICKYIDIPLQHASDRILHAMRRGSTKEKTARLIAAMRERVPGIAIRTTLIAGYPGETEEDFNEMLEWVQDMKFDRLGCFAYSHEEDTHAYNAEDDVPAEVKQERVERIMDAQRSVSLEKNRAKVGQRLTVIIDRAEGEYFIGRTEADSPEVDNEVIIHAPGQYLRIGDFAEVDITDAGEYDLHATLPNS